MMERVSQLMGEALRLQAEGVPPAGERGMAFAEKYWAMVLDFTGGDTAMLADLMKLSDRAEAQAPAGPSQEWQQKLADANAFISPALEAWFSARDYDPLGEGTK